MGGATAPSATNLPTMERRAYTNSTMSAEMEELVHSTETVWTDISGYFIAGNRLGFVQLYHTQMQACTLVQQRLSITYPDDLSE